MTAILNYFQTLSFTEKKYFLLLSFHVVLGCLFFAWPDLGSYYGILIIVVGLVYIIRNKNANHEVLQVAGYLIGSEVLLRMTYGFLNYEFVKCAIVLLAGLGIFYDGFSRRSVPYWIYLLALVPSLLFEKDLAAISRQNFNGIVFDLSGPICLGAMAIYLFDKNLTLKKLNTVMVAIGLPILSCGIYVFLYQPDIETYRRGVSSNLMFSGGFGPNQVSTMLGLGMFVFWMQFLLGMSKKRIAAINLLIFAFLCYLGLMTFSRGGMITGCAICVIFLYSIYRFFGTEGRALARKGSWYFAIVLLAVVSLVSLRTDGLLLKRYANRDHFGRVRKDQGFDREALAKRQLSLFIENPILGTGLGEGIKVQDIKKTRIVKSHDELTRLLANHGMTGLLDIFILILTPLVLFFKSRHNMYLAVFFSFWFLTINHSGMRTAAPALLYALMLSKVTIDRKGFLSNPTPSIATGS